MSDTLEVDESPCGTGLPREVYNDLLCPICLEFFKHPVILPCSHVLCRSPCTENLFDFNFIRCPVCRENCYVSGGLLSLPRVIPLESIIDKFRSERRKAIQTTTTTTTTATTTSNKRRAQHKIAAATTTTTDTGVAALSGSSNSSHARCAAHSSRSSSSTNAQQQQHLNPPGAQQDCYRDVDCSAYAQNGHSYSHVAAVCVQRSSSGNCSGSGSGGGGGSGGSGSGGGGGGGGGGGRALVLGDADFVPNAGACSETSSSSSSSPLLSPSSGALLAADFGSAASGNNRNPLLSPSSSSQTLPRTDPFPFPDHDSSLFSPASRILDRFDASLFDVSTDSVTSCSHHGSETSVYCEVCERCVCDVCGDSDHMTSHVTNSLEDSTLRAKVTLAHNLEKMTTSQKQVLTSLEQRRHCLKDMEQAFHRRSEEVNTQCDSLLAEVEHKRNFFLTDLEVEEHIRRSEVDDVIEILEKFLASSQSLAQYTKEVLEKDGASILQVTPALNEQLVASIIDCEACQCHPDNLHPDLSPGKVVDLRKEQTLLRDIRYLSPPATPSVDLGRCARSENTVALFLVASRQSDVIDSFVIRYGTEDQKALGIEESLTLYHTDNISTMATSATTTITNSNNNNSSHGWERRDLTPTTTTTTSNGEWTRDAGTSLNHHPYSPLQHHHHTHYTPLHPQHRSGPSSSSSSSSSSSACSFSSSHTPLDGVVVVLLENLLSGTPYLFCADAVNRAGSSSSGSSEGNQVVVRCITLPQSHSVVPVPVILEAMCHTDSTSIRVYSPSPKDVAPEQSISHFLLYRPRDLDRNRKWVWRCLPLQGRVDITVHGLEPCVQYEVVVMATNPRGECQISHRVVLETNGDDPAS